MGCQNDAPRIRDQMTAWVNCTIGSCQRHRGCMYTPCRIPKQRSAIAAFESERGLTPSDEQPAYDATVNNARGYRSRLRATGRPGTTVVTSQQNVGPSARHEALTVEPSVVSKMAIEAATS